MSKKLTQEEFIQKAKSVHGDKYDYSKVKYINYKTKIEIICKKHGSFWMIPMNHFKGCNCQKCSVEEVGKKHRLTLEDFIKRANKIHNNYYIYNKSIYKNIYTSLIITCPIHGDFEQKPNDHLSGCGCRKCSHLRINQSNTYSNEKFIKKANKIHNFKYDYSKVNYINFKTEVCIICKKHGEFWKLPSYHIQGAGCPKCASSKGEYEIEKWLNKNNFEFEKEKIFDDCKYIGYLRFDFYIPKHNLCIEFDGIQHFKPINFSGKLDKIQTIKNLKSCQIRDEIKTDYCLTNNIKLIRIKYDENVEEKLNKELLV